MNAEHCTATAGNNGSGYRQVYLCQVSRDVSCGACCGLYNVFDLSRPALEDRLARRSRLFAEVERTEDGIDRFRFEIKGWTPEERPFPRFHHCPFLGLIGQGETRVGCLLHPEVPGNRGRDFRYLSYYGAKACASYFCPTCQSMPSRHLMILHDLFHHWYDYGLIITEQRLLWAVFAILEARLGCPVSPLEVTSHSAAADGLRDLLRLKLAWPHRPKDAPGPCHFPFGNGLYRRPQIAWPMRERPEPLYQTLFQEMESRFATAQDVSRATEQLDHRLDALVSAMR